MVARNQVCVPNNQCSHGLPDYVAALFDVTERVRIESGLVELQQEQIDKGNDICCYIFGKSPCEWLEYGVVASDASENRFDP
jgi:hypothetical protein